MTDVEEIKKKSKDIWSGFAIFENLTGTAAPRLVKFAKITPNHKVLDVACGTGVVALTAARMGAKVTGIDLTPQLLERARENSAIFELQVDFQENDVEDLPFKSEEFDIVVSQFGHMFAPRPEEALSEMLRVLKPGGTIAFSTWPPELFMGKFFKIIGKYSPPMPEGTQPPVLWGNVDTVTKRLKNYVEEITFDRDRLTPPGLSIGHFLNMFEKGAGPLTRLLETLSAEPNKLRMLRSEIKALLADYFENNSLRQDYLLTRGIKK